MSDSSNQDPWLVRNLYWLLGFVGLLGVANIAVVLIAYSEYFGGPIERDHARWAQFGTILGGTLGPVLSFLALTGTLLALGSSTHEIRRKQRDDTDQDAKRKAIVFRLLSDEIQKRWREELFPSLIQLTRIIDPIESARRFALDAAVGADDMLVFKQVGTSFSDFYFLEDPELVSEIIHGHVLLRDLVDLHALAKANWDKNPDYLRATFIGKLDSLLTELNERYDRVYERVAA